MKKLILVLVILGLSNYTSAQELGIRFGNISGGNVAVDGVFSIGEFSRVHADLSFGDDGVGIDALWDFIYKPLGHDDFYWYVGAGPSLFIGDPFLIGASGEIGLEYRFDNVPIAIGLDWRPTFWIVENTEFDAGGFGLNIRYVFGK